ncbi:hypothetical protein NY049_02850 [Corynebacterium diphtheriae bv. gravis]|nr:hypothetical protein NY049_02850 [Corynebacterium diphtheriae bv. gravis]
MRGRKRKVRLSGVMTLTMFLKSAADYFVYFHTHFISTKIRSFFAAVATVFSALVFSCPLASAASDAIPEDATSRVVVEPGESFTFTFDDETSNDGVFTRSVNAVACTGTFAAPQAEAGGNHFLWLACQMHWNWVPSTKRKDLTPRRTFWIFL